MLPQAGRPGPSLGPWPNRSVGRSRALASRSAGYLRRWQSGVVGRSSPTRRPSLGRLAGFLARYDAKARLWRRPPVDLGRASAWLAEQRAKAHCVLTWADAGLLMDRWCGQEGRPVPALSRAEAEALVGAAHDEGFGLVLAVLGGGPASGAQVPSTSQWPARRTTLR